MPYNNLFEYENELSIDSKLVCPICFNPFNQPYVTPCQHRFCYNCITIWFNKCSSCPFCRQILFKEEIQLVNDKNFLNKLNKLKVKCLLCKKIGIKQKDFLNHIDNQCPKVIVSCRIGNPQCSWIGQRKDLQNHEKNCSLKPNEKQIKSLSSIEDLICEYPSNSHINLCDQQITDIHIPIIIQLAIVNKQCEILDLGANQIDSQGILQLAESLIWNKTLKILSLHRNYLSELSISYLVNRLSLNNSNLQWLDLESTDLNDKSAEYLANLLSKNTILTGLWLSNNRIGYQGVRALTKVLSYENKTLKYFDLENNPLINDSSLDHLSNMLIKNDSLTEVYLNNCQLSVNSKIKLDAIVSGKQNLCLFV